MADCTYSRCIQQRRNIKRDLQRWTKTMVYIVGLERIAEELMGRRKWKLYQQQDSMQRNNYLVDVVQQQQQHQQQLQHQSGTASLAGGPVTMKQEQASPMDRAPTATNNNSDLSPASAVKAEEDHQQQPDEDTDGHVRASSEDRDVGTAVSGEEDGDARAGEELPLQRSSSALSRLTPEPRDWSPQSKCHFCVDGKLQDDSCSLGPEHHQHLLTSHGGLSPRVHNQSDSDSTGDSMSDGESSPPSLLSASPTTGTAGLTNRRHRHRHHLHQQRHAHHPHHRHRPRSNSDATNNHHHHLNHLAPATAAKILQLAAHHLPTPLNMAALDSMTLAAIAAIGSGGNGSVNSDTGGTGNNQAAVAAATAAAAAAAAAASFSYYPGAPSLPSGATLQQQHNIFQIANAMRSAAAASAAAAAATVGGESDKGSDCSGGGRGEQPLDLSAKPTSIGTISTEKLAHKIRLAALDSKHIFNSDFRAKPRMPTVAGRRTYTEEELQAALRDIQSGKLGTRRAAVIYGIPRSTLRNKVYKLALERERETHLNSTSAATGGVVALKLDEEDDKMDDDKELSGAEEEKEVEKALRAPLLSMADFLRCSESNTPDALKSLLIGRPREPSTEYGPPPEPPQSPINPYLHSFLLGSGGFLSGKFEGDAINPGVLPELIKRMFEEQMAKAHHLQLQRNNGDDTRSSSVVRPSPSNSVIMRTVTRSESDMEAEESAANVILKIPSYKPTGSTSNNSSKNGDMSLYHRSSLDSSGSMVSPPVTSDSDSPPILCGGKNSGLHHPLKDVKDVIAASISKKFQLSEQLEQTRPALRHSISHTDSHILDFKRTGGFTPPLGGISVIKTQDLTKSYSNPQGQHAPSNKPLTHHLQQPQHSSSNSSGSGSSNAAGGKGTRPKRGKYRNYDRDSLVEAVRAVQRGEMSVHRAGSYYGVPHSTLEYKVKERHLMRPRKRDPKPNPVDEKIASLKLSDQQQQQQQQQQQLRLGQDKLPSGKSVPSGMKQPPQVKFPSNSPNGIKLPLFDPATAALAAGAPIGFNPGPFPFWAPTFHSHIPTLDFSPSQSFPNNSIEHHQPHQLLASQVMQKLHEDAARRSSSSSSLMGNHPSNSNSTSAISMPALPKSHRHIAESLLDGCTSNGSFLDGIIRSSLESGVPHADKIILEERNSIAPENLSNKALLEQLMCRNSRLNSNMSETSSGDEVDAVSYRKEVPSPSGMNDNSMEHDPETIELSNDSQDGRPARNLREDEETIQREEVIVKPPVQGRIYVKHDLMDRGPSEDLLRFHDSTMDRNGTMSVECPADEPLDHTID